MSQFFIGPFDKLQKASQSNQFYAILSLRSYNNTVRLKNKIIKKVNESYKNQLLKWKLNWITNYINKAWSKDNFFKVSLVQF